MKIRAIKIGLLALILALGSAQRGFCQSEALKVVVNELAFYQQKKDLKYLGNAQKSVDSLIKVSPDTLDLERNVYKAVVYATILNADTLNKLKEPDTFFPQTAYLVHRLSKKHKNGRFHDEIDYARRSVVNVYLRQGFGYLEKYDYRKALAVFARARRYAPDFKPLDAYIAWTNSKLGNLQDAARYYVGLVDNDSTKAEYAEAASNIYKSFGDTVEALKVVRKAREKFPKDRSLLLDEANIYNNGGDYSELVALLPDLLAIYPDNADVAFIAANCYDRLNHYDQAKPLYMRSIELNSVSFDPIFNLGLLYLKQSLLAKNDDAQEDRDQAEQWLKKANEISPYNVNCLRALRLLYAQTGNQFQIDRVNDKLKQLIN